MAKETIGEGLWGAEYAKLNRMFTELYTLVGTPVFVSGGTSWRLQARADGLHVDQTLTVTGFAGAENTDWVSLWTYVYESV